MAYLTNYNFSYLFKIAAADLIFEKDFIVTPQMFYEKIYENPSIYYLLGKLERANLLVVEMLLNADMTEFKNLLLAIKKDKVKLYRSEPPKYHIFKDCKLIYQDYINVFYPPDIDKNSILGKEYNEWLMNEIAEVKPYNYRKIIDYSKVRIIKEKYNYFFAPIHNLKKFADDFLPFQFLKNSGLFSKEEDNFDILNRKVDEILKYRKGFIGNVQMREDFSKFDFMVKQSDEKIIEFIKKRSNNTLNENDVPVIKKFWAKHMKIKEKVYEIILDYLKLTNDYEGKSFDYLVLEQVGYTCCAYCSQRSHSNP